MEEAIEVKEFKGFKPVNQYARERGITIQAAYHRARKGLILVKKIGNYILVKDK